MKKTALILGLNLITFGFTQAQGERFFTGAGCAGTGFSSLTNSSPWEVFNNVAGVNQLKGSYLLSGYTNLYQGTGITRAYAGVAFPWKKAGIGMSIMRTGEKDFGEIIAGISAANKIRNVSLGLKLNYYQFNITGVRTISRVILQFGGIAEISKHILFGAQVFNLNGARYSRETGAGIPVVMGAGITWKPLNKVKLHVSVEKEEFFFPAVRTGIEYLLENKLWVRTGFCSSPATPYAGIGIISKRYLLDYAFKSHSNLGFSHQISIACLLKQQVK